MTDLADRQHVLVVSFSDLRSDPRVWRQLSLLRDRFDVTAVGHADPRLPGVSFVRVPARHWPVLQKAWTAMLLKARRFEQVYWSSASTSEARRQLLGRSFDLIIANDIWALPLALQIKGQGRVLFDAHEYAPLEFDESWKWRFFLKGYNEYLCRRYVPLADAATTVCSGIAREYARTTGVRMEVVYNSPPCQALSPSHAAPGAPIRLVHHGGAIPSRQLEIMIEVMRHLDRRHMLDFVLVPSVPRYLDHLKSLAAGDDRIRFLPPVPMQELPGFLNAYDVGIYLLPPSNFNNCHALPNKFFEFVQARLAIAIGPSPEMAELVRRHGLGVVAGDFSPASFASALATLDRDSIDRCKAAADAAARELSYERAGEVLLNIVERMLGLPCAA